jgi:hypothetical protein
MYLKEIVAIGFMKVTFVVIFKRKNETYEFIIDGMSSFIIKNIEFFFTLFIYLGVGLRNLFFKRNFFQ